MRLFLFLALALTASSAQAQGESRPVPTDTVAVGTIGATPGSDRMDVILRGTLDGRTVEFVRGQVLVGLEPPACPEDLATLVEALGLVVLQPFEPNPPGSRLKFQFAVLRVPADQDFGSAIQALRASQHVQYVTLNGIVRGGGDRDA